MRLISVCASFVAGKTRVTVAGVLSSFHFVSWTLNKNVRKEGGNGRRQPSYDGSSDMINDRRREEEGPPPLCTSALVVATRILGWKERTPYCRFVALSF